jgi:hypothetical protein
MSMMMLNTKSSSLRLLGLSHQVNGTSCRMPLPPLLLLLLLLLLLSLLSLSLLLAASSVAKKLSTCSVCSRIPLMRLCAAAAW